MKKMILGMFLAAGFLASKSASAQYFVVDTDTSKSKWMAPTYSVEGKIRVTIPSSVSGPVQIDWNVTSIVEPSGWNWSGFCEPSSLGSCWTPDADMKGGKLYATGSMAPGYSNTFKSDFDGDAAADYTAAYVTINLAYASQTKKIVFAAYKTPTGISTSVLKDADVNIFPNPANNFIDVMYASSADVKSITVYNLIGKAVSVYKVTDKNSAHCEFPADMPSGIYIVRVADSRGNVIATRKITHQ